MDDEAHRMRVARQRLEALALRVPHLRTLVAEPGRQARDLVSAPAMRVDLSRQRWDEEIRSALLDFAAASGVIETRGELFRSNALNPTEQRGVLHTTLRMPRDTMLVHDGVDIVSEVHQALDRALTLAEQIRDGGWRGGTGERIEDVVNIGIGGSALGPALVCDALEPSSAPGPRVHFLTNVDGHEVDLLLRRLDPERTLFIVASKSFGTLETRVNAQTARRWFLDSGGSEADIRHHFVAVSTNLEAAAAFGLPEENLLPMWDWVGGRFSLWSPIGLPIAIRHGAAAFRSLLGGAREMDLHFRDTPIERNAPLLLALAETWNGNFLGARSHAVLPYASALARLPDYLQQLEMESNGKRVTIDGAPLEHDTATVLWGNVGTTGQHAYHQLLHQGTQAFSAEFVLPIAHGHPHGDHHRWLVAHCFAQAEAMARGRTTQEVRSALEAEGMSAEDAERAAPHRALPGDHASTLVLLDDLSPRSLGALVALHEHKVFTQGIIWRINSFDQWGVELGKVLGDRIHDVLAGQADAADAIEDPITQGLIRIYRDAARD